MNNGSSKIQSFTDLETWKKSHQLVLYICKITKDLPKEEKLGLIGQIRRVAVSITSNIAEGFGRKSYKEKVQFYRMAVSSLYETQNQLLIAKDVSYITKNVFDEFSKQSIVVSKLINGLIKSSRERSLDS